MSRFVFLTLKYWTFLSVTNSNSIHMCSRWCHMQNIKNNIDGALCIAHLGRNNAASFCDLNAYNRCRYCFFNSLYRITTDIEARVLRDIKFDLYWL